MVNELEKLVEATLGGIGKQCSEKNFDHIYIVDTNIVHGFPEAISILAEDKKLKDNAKPNMIIVSDVVRRELNGLKKHENVEIAIDARIALKGISHYFRNLQGIEEGGYQIGAKFENGSVMIILPYSAEKFPKTRADFKGDDQIISSALALKKQLKERDKISIVSDDADMLSSCTQFKIKSSRFEEFYRDYDYSGFVEVELGKLMGKAKQKEALEIYKLLQEKNDISVDMVEQLIEKTINPNQFLRFFADGISAKKTYRVDVRKKTASSNLKNFHKFMIDRKSAGLGSAYVPDWDQECALELLYDPEIDYVTLSGPPGGGKTMLPLDVGLIMLSKEKIYSLLVSNPPIIGNHGYMPGSKREKLKVENQNIFDALYFLYGANGKNKKSKADVESIVEQMIEKGELELETLAYVKGRTLQKRMIVFDEAEDYEPKQMRKLASRLGHGSKMVFSGDPYQIDNPRCSKARNGLVYFISKFKGQNNYGHITINNVQRSKGAEQSAKLL